MERARVCNLETPRLSGVVSHVLPRIGHLGGRAFIHHMNLEVVFEVGSGGICFGLGCRLGLPVWSFIEQLQEEFPTRPAGVTRVDLADSVTRPKHPPADRSGGSLILSLSVGADQPRPVLDTPCRFVSDVVLFFREHGVNGALLFRYQRRPKGRLPLAAQGE